VVAAGERLTVPLARPGCVVMHLVLSQPGALDPGAGSLEDGVERGGEARSAFADQELTPPSRSPKLRARLRACWTVHSPAGLAVTPPICIRGLPCPVNTRTCSLLGKAVSTCQQMTARIPAAGASGTSARPGPSRAVPDRCPRPAGSSEPRQRGCHAGLHECAVDAAVSPQRIFQADDRAGDARALPASWLAPLARAVRPPAASLRCQARTVTCGNSAKVTIYSSRE
jgi:hypothetical protein